LFLSRAPLTYFVGGGFAYISCLFTIPVGIIARMFFNRFPAVMNGFSALILTVLVFSSTAAFQTAFPYANSYMWPTLFIGMVTTAAFEVWRIRQAKRRLRAAG
jgi:di/tricarboxylate transporter